MSAPHYFSLIAVTVGVVGALVHGAHYLFGTNGTAIKLMPPLSDHYKLVGKVAVVEWDDTKRALTSQIGKRLDSEPLVIKNSPTKQWSGLKRWQDQGYIRNAIEHFQLATTVRRGFYYFYESKKRPFAKESHGTPLWWQHQRQDGLSSSDFFSRNCVAKGENVQRQFYDYVQGWVADFEMLAADVEPLSWMSLISGGQGRHQVWLGCGAGAGSQTHFDYSHNVVAQVTGSKTFVLTPPSEDNWRLLSDFPRLSPLVSFSKRNFSSRRNGQPQIESVAVTLRPGDILYIPPLWWHHVVVNEESPSLGINYFSSKDMLMTLEGMPLPTSVHGKGIGKSQRYLATASFLDFMLRYLLPNTSLQAFARKVLEIRYLNLPGGWHSETANCPKSPVADCSFTSGKSEGLIPDAELADINGAQISTILNEWKYAKGSVKLQILLADYMEDLLNYVAGASSVCWYLHCIATMTA